jgi:iodotyrosine deiodinase
MTSAQYHDLSSYREYPPEEMRRRAAQFLAEMRRRRTVRQFSDRPVPIDLIRDCLLTAATAPSGNNQQPWHFVAVSDPAVKKQLQAAAEKVEEGFYAGEATRQWAQALSHLGTNARKPFLSLAPWLIAVFAERYGLNSDGSKQKYYYIQESVGISVGMLISAVHNAGLVSLTYTPSRMGFLNRILKQSERYKPFMILVVGHPAENCTVPVLKKKSIEQVVTFL